MNDTYSLDEDYQFRFFKKQNPVVYKTKSQIRGKN